MIDLTKGEHKSPVMTVIRIERLGPVVLAIREDSLGAAGFGGSLLACAGLFAHVLFAFQSSLREFDNLEYSAADAPSNRASDDNDLRR